MKITERRLRQIIRSVIKESRINEMMGDMHHFDALEGARAVSDLASELMRTPVNSLKNPRKKDHLEKTINEFLAGIGLASGRAAYAIALSTPLMTFLKMCADFDGFASGAITIGLLIAVLYTGHAAARRLAKRLGVTYVEPRIDGSIKAKVYDNLTITAEDMAALEEALSRPR